MNINSISYVYLYTILTKFMLCDASPQSGQLWNRICWAARSPPSFVWIATTLDFWGGVGHTHPPPHPLRPARGRGRLDLRRRHTGFPAPAVSSRPLVGGGRGASSQPFFWIRQKYQRVIKDSASKGCANVMVCICNESKWVWRLLCCSRVK